MDAFKKSSRYQMFSTELLYAGALTWDSGQTDQMVSPIYRNDIRFLVGMNITCRNTQKKPRIKWCLLVVGPEGVQLNTSRASRLAFFNGGGTHLIVRPTIYFMCPSLSKLHPPFIIPNGDDFYPVKILSIYNLLHLFHLER